MGDLAHRIANSQLVADLLQRCNFPNTPAVAAVSGGADSLCLAVLAKQQGCLSKIIHVNHQLRDDSHLDVNVIKHVADELNIELTVVTVDVGHGTNLEARAREARYAVFPEGTMTGHTMDDQAETVLINLLRGSGTAGLAGMRMDTTHPILGIRRSETHALCSELKIEVVNDSTNLDPTHQRNRIRHEVLPLLNDVSKRDLAPILARQAEIMRVDDEALENLAAQYDPTDARLLASLEPAIAKRVLRRWLCDPYPPDSATIERAMAVVRGESLGTDLGGGRHLSRHQQRLKIS